MPASRTTPPGAIGAAATLADEQSSRAAAPAPNGAAGGTPRARVLVIDDDPAVCRMLQLALEIAGYAVTSLSHPREALAHLESQAVDLVITDLVMPDVEGIEIIMRASRAQRPLPIIAISGAGADGPDDYLAIARLLGADRTLSKPFDCRQLLDMVDELLARGR